MEKVFLEGVIDDEFISRYKTTANVVIEGCIPVENIGDIQPGDLEKENNLVN